VRVSRESRLSRQKTLSLPNKQIRRRHSGGAAYFAGWVHLGVCFADGQTTEETKDDGLPHKGTLNLNTDHSSCNALVGSMREA
jgi:hypothetical protein